MYSSFSCALEERRKYNQSISHPLEHHVETFLAPLAISLYLLVAQAEETRYTHAQQHKQCIRHGEWVAQYYHGEGQPHWLFHKLHETRQHEGKSMTTNQPLSLFISSKMTELAEERRAVQSALSAYQMFGWLYEKDAGARPDTIQSAYLKEVEACDIYIGLFWQGYGQQSKTGISANNFYRMTVSVQH